MADNVVLSTNVGTGSTLATDDVTDAGGAHYQRIKITDGEANSTTHLDVVADDAAVATGDTGLLAMAVATPTDTAVDANDTGFMGMSTDRRLHTDSDIAIDGTSVTGGSGAVAAGTPRVTLASNDPAVAKLGTIDTDTGVIAGDTTSIDGKITACDTGAVANAGTFAVQDNSYSEDAITPATITGPTVMMERDDALSSLTPIAGDWAAARCSAEGALWVQEFNSDAILADTASMDTNLATIAGAVSTEMQVDVVGALPPGGNTIGKLGANSGVDIGDVDVTSITGVTMSNAGMQITGDEAHDAADAGNPLKIGGKAKAFDGTAAGTDVAEDDRVDANFTVDGRQFVETAHPNYWSASTDKATPATNATIKAAPGVGLKLYITDVIVSNGATAGNITLLNGSGGTVLLELYPAINGGMTHAFRTPLALSTNTLLALTSTTVTTHSVTVSGFIAA